MLGVVSKFSNTSVSRKIPPTYRRETRLKTFLKCSSNVVNRYSKVSAEKSLYDEARAEKIEYTNWGNTFFIGLEKSKNCSSFEWRISISKKCCVC